ncbi:homoisocitrate dehydrogenase [Methanococcus aeolicus]|uniref:homoisocitrate dehydrogenase n=1 Tax=Methanococcus aeolicus TaxID=42879 RepID=UPI0012F63F2C|nr:homoisocitrate dehydrogenase [Methanococcus aeolicus]
MLKIPKICVIEGDGIGKEVIPETVRILKEIGDFEFIYEHAGYECFKRCGDAIPEKTLKTAKECDAILFGAVSTPKLDETERKPYKSPILTLRKELDLYANVRPIHKLDNSDSSNNIDFIIIRENTEGLYSGVEYYDEEKELAISERHISKKGSKRIIKFAFEYAVKHHRKKVSCIHKSNILRITDGLFLNIFNEFKEKYKNEYNIEGNDYLVDATAMYILKSPQMFDVIVTTNLFGDILSDEASGLLGGLGLAPSANIGDNYGLFEPVHGSAPDIAGKGVANPIAAVLSASMMLYYLDMKEKSRLLKDAVKQVLAHKDITPDLGGNLKTKEVSDKIIEELRKIS